MAIDRGQGISVTTTLADSYDVGNLVEEATEAKVAAESAKDTAVSSAETASSDASSASDSATSASNSASSASDDAGTASTKAGEALASATTAGEAKDDAIDAKNDAVTAKNDAVTAKNAAVTAQQAAENALDAFEDVYLGAKSSDPSTDNDGNALVAGTWYFNTDSDRAKIYDGTDWDYLTFDTTNFATQSSSTGALHLPSGTTTQRDSSPETGDLRWNTSDNKSELFNGTSWENFGGAGDDNVQSNWAETDASRDDYIINKPGNATTTTDGFMSSADKTKLTNIEVAAEVNNITDTDSVNLTGSGDTSLHYHSSDRSRANHTGTQTLSTISDVTATATEVNYTDGVTSNIQTQLDGKSGTGHNHDHDALTNYVADEHIDWTTDQGATNIHSGNYENTTYTASGVVSIDANNNITSTAEANVQADWNATSGDAQILNKPSGFLTLGESSTTAYRGDRGKIAYDHSQSTHAPTNAEVNRTMDADPTSGNTANSVSSAGVYSALAGKSDDDHSHSNLDNYVSWTISDGTNSEAITAGATLNITGSGDTTATYTASTNTLDISSTDSGDTTYSAGTALDLSGTTFNVDLSELGTTGATDHYFIVTDDSHNQYRIPKASVDINEFDKTNLSITLSKVSDSGGLAAKNSITVEDVTIAGTDGDGKVLTSDGAGGFEWGTAGAGEANVQSDWNQNTTTEDDFIKNKPTLGTSSSLNVASTGDASTAQVVKGDDSRLSDARTPTAHSHDVEGTALKSTGETGGTKFLREDGDGTSSWQTIPDTKWDGGSTDLNAVTGRASLGLGDSATKNVGTGETNVAAGNHNHDTVYSDINHNHSGIYEPADSSILKSTDIGVSVQAYDADTAKLDVAQSWTKAQRGSITALTDTTVIAMDASTNNFFSITLGGNRTVGTPTNLVAGQSGSIFITQDATGSRLLAFSTVWDFAGGTAPTLSTTANAVDRLDYVVRTTGSIHASLTAGVS